MILPIVGKVKFFIIVLMISCYYFKLCTFFYFKSARNIYSSMI